MESSQFFIPKKPLNEPLLKGFSGVVGIPGWNKTFTYLKWERFQGYPSDSDFPNRLLGLPGAE